MSIFTTMRQPELQREEAVKLFVSIIQAVPESIPKNLSSEELLKYIIAGAENLIDYVLTGKKD
ncbi:MAG: hypothetical protein LBF77_04480 [Spirochaetaceae bacterium]|jgi:hypothetical protein|nr:hypothetical protein [Spirochaetaceae bacterium]